jgi:hypothetical protein
MAGVRKTGVLVQDSKDAAAILQEAKPDACIITTASLIQDLKGPFMDCAESGVNAITTGEETFYPWNSSYQTTRLLDDVARRNGCTLCGSGYQDVLWGNLITTLAGATHTIRKITGKSRYNVEDYGLALAKVHGAGLSLADFEKESAAADKIPDAERKALVDREAFLPSYMWNVNGWLCARLGLNGGCVPSKTLLRSAETLSEADSVRTFEASRVEWTADCGKVSKRVLAMARDLSDAGAAAALEATGVTLFRPWASSPPRGPLVRSPGRDSRRAR